MDHDAAKHSPYTARDRVAGPILPDAPITDRDRRIVEVLTERVRFLTLGQIARVWWSHDPHSIPTVTRRLHRLVDLGLVRTCRVMLHPELSLRAPLATWSPGRTRPDFGAVSYAARSRWTEPLRSEPIAFATARAADAAGGHAGRAPKPSEATHDAHLATLYLRFMTDRPAAAATWRHESDILASRHTVRTRRRRRRFEKLPDAVINECGQCVTVEFAGAYARDRVRAFHLYCETQGMRYELW